MVSSKVVGQWLASICGGCLIGIAALLAGCGSSSGGEAAASKEDAGVTLSACVSADTKACSSFAFPTEDGGTSTIQLGPYGAQADVNVGKGFENTVQSTDQNGGPPSAGCQVFADLFMEPANITNMLLETSKNGVTINFALYSAYRPANWPDKPVPVITWGNGTCAQPEGYGALLRYVASYGYFIIAANSRQVGSNNSDGSQPMLKALDYAAAANKDPSSPYYGHLDMSMVGAMGHSQGGAATIAAASDKRVQYILPFNALSGSSSIPKPYLEVSGDLDVVPTTPSAMASQVNASPKAAWLYYHNPIGQGSIRGHLVLMLSPERVDDQAVSWWEMLFRDDATAKAKFVGANCGFCGHAMDPTNAYEFGEHGLD